MQARGARRVGRPRAAHLCAHFPTHSLTYTGSLYLLSGVFGTMVSVVFLPEVLSVGASASVFGLIGACPSCPRSNPNPNPNPNPNSSPNPNPNPSLNRIGAHWTG